MTLFCTSQRFDEVTPHALRSGIAHGLALAAMMKELHLRGAPITQRLTVPASLTFHESICLTPHDVD